MTQKEFSNKVKESLWESKLNLERHRIWNELSNHRRDLSFNSSIRITSDDAHAIIFDE